MKKLLSLVFGLAVLVGFSMTSANAKTLKCQTVLNTKADEVKMLKDFTDTVTELTDGSLKFEILPAGAVVGVKETLDAVDKGLIDCGFAWTHYWSGDHPAAMLFGSPVAGGGVGIDNLAFYLGSNMVVVKNYTTNFGKKWVETLKDLCFNQLAQKL